MSSVKETGFDPQRVVHNGSKFLLGNGYMGYRGTLDEDTAAECVALNLAGVYDRVGDKWRETVNAPNPLFTEIKINGAALNPRSCPPEKHRLKLNLDSAYFERRTVYLAEGKRVHIESKRFLDMNHYKNLASVYTLRAEEDAEAEIRVGIDTDIWDLNGPHLVNMTCCERGGIMVAGAVTSEQGISVAVALAINTDFGQPRETVSDHGIYKVFRLKLRANKTYTVYKYACVCYGGDALQEAADAAAAQAEKGYAAIFKAHASLWKKLWQIYGVTLTGDEEANFALQYSIYHVLSLTPRGRGSIAARGLSGQTYKGAVFWDTEIFLLPVFLCHDTETAKKLIRYRIEGLKGARIKAAEYGYEGAFYAWESQEEGYEGCGDFNVTDVFTHRPVRTYFRDKQIHISGDVAYALCRYFEMTADFDTLMDGGLEMLMECSRFFLSYAKYNVLKDRFELNDVIGPDEYHERVNNNAFTNYLAHDTVKNTLEYLKLAEKRAPEAYEALLDRLKYRPHLKLLKDFLKKLYLPQPNENGIIEQFEGYFKLEDASVQEVKARLAHPSEYWGGSGGVATATQVIKQADTVALIEFFPGLFATSIAQKNWDYYLPRTEHGSSLSACMYAVTACRIGRPNEAYPWFLKTANVDLTGQSKQYAGEVYIGGTHPAANGGAWMTAVLGFAGLTYRGRKAVLEPRLPDKIEEIAFCALDNGRLTRFRVSRAGVKKRRKRC